ncbi:glycerophosphoryl diester phosphodiesterase [Microbacterium sp. W4I4]|uniref:glycerophosphodiester phosphodiesterase family protein n=1 Tax=Microbacterium sp. W4I4 TaxID=3042295 RepID=UPI002780E5A7|nr:glycerophosphodiester phosphodiesterase family protein [Microbacterium sp. W4I4]MDQ0614447.1 glycerophosphoryl diester phosphodiesterase [Microbacterium sp. W4I4]
MTPASRRFIAHRGVHLGGTIAGENSLEAVRLARRAGFACIETDTRLSADGELVVMHDETLNRTATDAAGRELSDPVPVHEVSLARLRADYRLKARDAQNRTRIPTLEEYLTECAAAGLLPFIEIKLIDQAPSFYRRVLDVADSTLGRGGYVMTSNGNANRRIRGMGVHDVPLMDIRHQASTFEDVAALGEVTVAISATRYEREEHAVHVAQARGRGLATESHADDHGVFSVADDHGVDLISTDVLAPDLRDDAHVIAHALAPGAFEHSGRVVGDELVLAPGETVVLPASWPQPRFGGLFLALEFAGAAEVRLGPQRFSLESERLRRTRHQVLLDAATAAFVLTALGPCRLRGLEVTVAEY